MRIENGFKYLGTIFNGIQNWIFHLTMENGKKRKCFLLVCVCDENTEDLLS